MSMTVTVTGFDFDINTDDWQHAADGERCAGLIHDRLFALGERDPDLVAQVHSELAGGEPLPGLRPTGLEVAQNIANAAWDEVTRDYTDRATMTGHNAEISAA